VDATTLNGTYKKEYDPGELFRVEAQLAKVTLADISRPLTEVEARGALDML
jgi:hypothetical protein